MEYENKSINNEQKVKVDNTSNNTSTELIHNEEIGIQTTY